MQAVQDLATQWEPGIQNLHLAFFAKYIVPLPQSYCRSDSFKADKIKELSHTASSRLYLSPRYYGSTEKMLGSKIRPILLAPRRT